MTTKTFEVISGLKEGDKIQLVRAK